MLISLTILGVLLAIPNAISLNSVDNMTRGAISASVKHSLNKQTSAFTGHTITASPREAQSEKLKTAYTFDMLDWWQTVSIDPQDGQMYIAGINPNGDNGNYYTEYSSIVYYSPFGGYHLELDQGSGYITYFGINLTGYTGADSVRIEWTVRGKRRGSYQYIIVNGPRSWADPNETDTTRWVTWYWTLPATDFNWNSTANYISIGSQGRSTAPLCWRETFVWIFGARGSGQPPPAPTPVSPPDGSTVNTLTPTLQVQSMSGVDQYHWIVKDAGNNVVVEGTSSGPTWTVPSGYLSWQTWYWWSCQAHNSSGWGRYFEPSWRFYTGTSGQPPPAPTPVSPPDGSTVNTLTPTLQVQSMSGVDQYHWIVKDAGNNVVVEGTSSGPTWTVPSGYLSWQTWYWWSCQAHNSSGWGRYFEPSWRFYTGTGGVDTLRYDDGIEENAWAWYDANNGWGGVFTPSWYPCYLIGALLRFWNSSWPNPGSNRIKIRVVDDNGSGGSPGATLWESGILTCNRGAWKYFSLPNIQITSGKFYIFYIQPDDYPNCPGLSVDTIRYYPNPWWKYISGAYSVDSTYDGDFMIRAIVSSQSGIIEELTPSTKLTTPFELGPATPNPFSKQTTIYYALSKETEVNLAIFDASGQLVRTLVNEKQKQGNYNVSWNVRGVSQKKLPNGVYFYRLEAGEFKATKKMVKAE